MIWDDGYLNRLRTDGEQDMCNRVPCLFHRFALQIVGGQSPYTLPVKSNRLRRVTWLGRKIYPITLDDMMILNPAFIYADSTHKTEIPLGTPQYYLLHPTNLNDIRFYPCPDQNIAIDGLDVNGIGIATNVIISCFRNIDGTDATAQLPDYIYRRSIKAYVLWKAFLQEGKGQDTKASAYYGSKYMYYVKLFEKLNSDAFVSKKYSLSDVPPQVARPGRPLLPANFER